MELAIEIKAKLGCFQELDQTLQSLLPTIRKEKGCRECRIYRDVEDLAGAEPEAMYGELCRLRGARIDRCVLYVFRCAVYYANHQSHDPELLKWWHWKDRSDVDS